MTANTIAENRQRSLHPTRNVWLFGYGSLIYKTGFPFLQRRPASIRGWERRLWQGSHDHRGTPEAPGRVVTLVQRSGAICHGVGYLVAPAVFAELDVREKNGYLRKKAPLHFTDGSQADGLVYVAIGQNAAFLGPASELKIARHVETASGPSGTNRDYVLKLAAALRDLGARDPHIETVAQHLLDIGNASANLCGRST